MPTTNAQQFEADLKAAKNGDTVSLKGNITKNIVINKLVNLDLNGKKITGNVTINTPAKGTINLKNGSIDGNLTVEAPQATVNNELTVTGNININNVAFGTWNEKANGNKLVVNDPDGIKLTVAPGKTVATITVAPEAVGEVTITNNGTIEKVDAQASVELVNNAGATTNLVTGTAPVDVKGEGTVGDNNNTTDPAVIALEAAKTAVKAYEDAPITTLEEIANTNSLRATAEIKVSAVADGVAKQELTSRIEVQNGKVQAAKEDLLIYAAQTAINKIAEVQDIYSDEYKSAVHAANTATDAARTAGVQDTQIGEEFVAMLDAANDFLAPVSATLSGGGVFNFEGVNTFNVTANSKIGAKGTEGVHFAGQEWASSNAQGFSYTTDGAFYTIELTKDNTPVEFNTVFDTFALQTQGSANIQDYSQASTGRTGADFGNAGHTGTKLYSASPWNEVGTLYYGIHSNIAGVNFTNGATAAIDITGTLKSDATDGSYKITVTMYESARVTKDLKHANKDSLKPLGTVNYTFTVSAVPAP
ncbi:hypothetical protein [Sporosarcina sp. P33]|uniref:hypothetical protein n=1 Tax=Sporosarcina sp. P33 TaxID=1930764 RepID=UPI0009BDBBBC|nr:hypothetical protein [Sporosarcina sp. P33]ARD48831.1 hypothetical protein SporoP33_11755 [Sporosarcina sp. P33]